MKLVYLILFTFINLQLFSQNNNQNSQNNGNNRPRRGQNSGSANQTIFQQNQQQQPTNSEQIQGTSTTTSQPNVQTQSTNSSSSSGSYSNTAGGSGYYGEPMYVFSIDSVSLNAMWNLTARATVGSMKVTSYASSVSMDVLSFQVPYLKDVMQLVMIHAPLNKSIHHLTKDLQKLLANNGIVNWKNDPLIALAIGSGYKKANINNTTWEEIKLQFGNIYTPSILEFFEKGYEL